MNQQTTGVILVRHGRSTYNDQGLFQGCCDDSVLTDKGKLEAHRTGIALQNIAIDAIFSSPLQRTKQTAQEICSVINCSLTIKTHPNLQEVDLPGWEGLSFQDVRENLADDYRIWQEFPDQFQMSSSLTTNKPEYPVLNLYKRAEQFWQEILPYYQGKTILIVSHGGTIRALISTALGIKSDRYHFLQQSNCGISILHFDSQNSKKSCLTAMNVTSYLGETLPKLKEGKTGIRLILLPDNHLKTNQFQALIKSLQPVNLNCCFHNAQAKFLPIIQSLKIDLIRLPNSQHYFLDNCYQRIKFNAQFSSLYTGSVIYTGLVIADTRIIQSALVEILGSSINPHSLILQTGTMTIIHYPVSTHRPIIQAINFTAIK